MMDYLVALALSTLTAKDALDKVGMYTAITRLNHEDYRAFTSSILLLGKLDQATMIMAFQNEDLKWQSLTSSQVAALTTWNRQTNPFCKKRGYLSERYWIAHSKLQPAHLTLRSNNNARSANSRIEVKVKDKQAQQFVTSASL